MMETVVFVAPLGHAPLAQETAFSLAAAAICGNVTDTREKKRLSMVK
ncbi:MAG: hypothetical protein GY782_09240 [Gammaproteobacteria bacterium]|nr:hypothetical protein [Gammaproteobacteria bacterium]